MMFFQVALLLGYLYSHLLKSCLSPRHSAIVHALAACLAGFTIDFETLNLASSFNGNLSAAVCLKLLSSIAFAFIILSATSPLLQWWFSYTHKDQNPYRLYALSNIGSLLGLFAYPLVVERFELNAQSSGWTIAYLVVAAVLIASGWQAISINPTPSGKTNDQEKHSSATSIVCWIVLSATASLMLIATTNLLSQEVAAHPLLWVSPLAAYLLSIVFCFERPDLYKRHWFLPLFTITIFVAILLFHLGTNAGLILQTVGFLALLMVGSIVCHGELYRIRPNTEKLTGFYLAMAIGGALGGALGVLIAPNVFDGFYEFHTSILLCLIVSTAIVFSDRKKKPHGSSRLLYGYFFISTVAASPVLCSLLYSIQPEFQPELIFRDRNAYGIVSVTETDNYRKMYNGQTNHGGQFLDGAKSVLPSAYYTKGSGVDIAFRYARQHDETAIRHLNVGIIGLGTGSMLAYHQPNDQFTFYELNPICEFAAREYFTFLNQFEPEVVIGDGRVMLQDELEKNGSNRFDLIFLDAFSSDSIPIHLLTTEAIDLYLKHLNEDGLLIFHITNRFVDLRPVIWALVHDNGLSAATFEHTNQQFDIKTRWIITTRDSDFLKNAIIKKHQLVEKDEIAELLWTDQCAPLSPIVIWSNQIRTKR